MAQDVVGGRGMEVEIREGDVAEKLLPLQRPGLVGAGGKCDLAAVGAFELRGFEVVQVSAIARFGPGLDRALRDRLALVRNHQVEVHIDGVSESLASRAGAKRIVE